MSNVIAEYNLPDFVAGNTWVGVPLMTITPPTGAGNLDEVEIQFRQNSPSSPTYIAKLSISGGEITLVSAANWQFTIPAQVLPLSAGTYFQSIKLYDDSATPKPFTYTQGTITGILAPTRS